MKLSLWSGMLREWPPESAIRLLAEAGFSCVEFGCRHEASYLEGQPNEDHILAGIRSTAGSLQMDIPQMHAPLFNICTCDDEQISWLHRSVRRAAALGAKWLVVHPGTCVGMASDPKAATQTRERNLEVLGSLLQLAAALGTGIAIENMSGTRPRFGTTVTDLLWLLSELPSGHVGICWDTGHALLSNIDQGVAIRALGQHLVAIHVHDNDGSGDRHWAPYCGKNDWPEIIHALRDINFPGPFNLEVSHEWRTTPQPVRLAKMRYLADLAHMMLEID